MVMLIRAICPIIRCKYRFLFCNEKKLNGWTFPQNHFNKLNYDLNKKSAKWRFNSFYKRKINLHLLHPLPVYHRKNHHRHHLQ
jgi:hypothetical protein